MKLEGSRGRARTFGLTAISLSAHVIMFTMLGLVPPPSDVLAMREMEFTIAEPEPETPPPEPEPEPEPEPPEPEPPKARAPKAPPQAPEPPPPSDKAPPQEAPPEEVADFTGTTLTGDGPGSWATRVGSGAPLTGPVGKIGRKPPTSGDQVASKPAGPTGPRVVPLGSLARKPAAPAGLDALLERHYPKRARVQGVEGKAVVAVRVLPTGRLTDMRIVREWPSGFEFAEACRKLLREAPAFVPPLDRDGTAVAADIDFTCDFVVDY